MVFLKGLQGCCKAPGKAFLFLDLGKISPLIICLVRQRSSWGLGWTLWRRETPYERFTEELQWRLGALSIHIKFSNKRYRYYGFSFKKSKICQKKAEIGQDV
jgi:hypothetical protein